MGHGHPIQYPADFGRMNEINVRPGMNEAWALEQQHMRALEENAKTNWATEFGNSPQSNASASSTSVPQQAILGRPDCKSCL